MDTWWCRKDDLDEDQQKVMQLGVDGSYWVSGPPGSGKTNLLLMRAAYLALSSKNICVIVFTRTLAEFLRSGASRYRLNPECILTYNQWVWRLAGEAGLERPSTQDFDELRRWSLSVLQRLGEAGPIFDTVLVDEAQDYKPEELRAIRRLSRECFFTSDVRQRLYLSTDEVAVLNDLVDDHIELEFHYRNALGICELADKIGQQFATTHGYKRISPGCCYPTSAPKEDVRVLNIDFDDQVREIAARIKLQLRAFPDELIGVIAPRTTDVSSLQAGLIEAGMGQYLTVQIGKESVIDFASSKAVVLATIHAAKGLEFRAVHFPCAEYVKNSPHQKRIAFTAVTRAKTSLAIYHSNALPQWFDSAVKDYRQSQFTPDNWEDVFDENE